MALLLVLSVVISSIFVLVDGVFLILPDSNVVLVLLVLFVVLSTYKSWLATKRRVQVTWPDQPKQHSSEHCPILSGSMSVRISVPATIAAGA